MIRFCVSIPPSINATYKSGAGRFYKDPKAKKWLEYAKIELLSTRRGVLPAGRYSVIITLDGMKSNADLDNRIKPLLDLAQLCGVIQNDSLIDELHVFRGSKTGEKKAYVVIEIKK